MPGLEVPLAWWVIGGALPVLIASPITYALVRQSERIAALHARLSAANIELRRRVDIDQLTGAWNRAAFTTHVSRRRETMPGWFLVVDIDSFKGINDAFGHAAGDAALRHVCLLLIAGAGAEALVGRIGGEEFAIWLAASDESTAVRLADELRRAIAARPIAIIDGRRLSVTVSIGVAGGDGLGIDDAIHRADRAMYRAKQDGRNRVRRSA
ncbi:hypothetical protein IP88_14480 [alpha proteobacterium AAP81b]|nr:hypothetical protein IP88_14480 [alpha proteobacterium AAP81b]